MKQEEIYLVKNYPDEISAREEMGRYISSSTISPGHAKRSLISPRPMSTSVRFSSLPESPVIYGSPA